MTKENNEWTEEWEAAGEDDERMREEVSECLIYVHYGTLATY
jgi:hypothetical protein